MSNYLSAAYSKRATPQTEPIPGDVQTKNNAGGFVYALNPWKQFERFCILGAENGTYYVSERKLVRDNAKVVEACIAEDGIRAVNLIVAISDQGLAPKNDPALFALALAASAKDVKTRQYALGQLGKVARIPTHLFHFLEFCKNLRGWGPTLRRAVQDWYNSQEVDKLAYEVTKYIQRDGWSNRDCLRKAHPIAPEGEGSTRNLLYRYITQGIDGVKLLSPLSGLPNIIHAFEDLKGEFLKENGQPNYQVAVDSIRTSNLSREMLPTEALTRPEVWEALLEKMPYTAMLRNLGNMAKVGLLKPLSSAETTIAGRLIDQLRIQKARVHPISILLAMKTFSSGHGLKGSGTWTVSPRVVDALDEAFYLAFKYLAPTNKRYLLGLDVSGSMSWATCGGLPITPAEGAAAMALSIAKVEPSHYIHGFCNTFVDLGITPKMRLDAALERTKKSTFGSTDCALPAVWALKNKVEVDCICVVTDNETYAGHIHPKQALHEYRQKMGIPVKQVVIGMTSSGFSIASPNDPLSLDVVGFDASVPQVIQSFVKG